jgi:hypothetical protein
VLSVVSSAEIVFCEYYECISKIFPLIGSLKLLKIFKVINSFKIFSIMCSRHVLLIYQFDNISYNRPGSSVGIATAYGLDGPGIESRWGRDFPHLSRPALRPTQPPVQRIPGLSRGVRCGRRVTLTPHPLLVPRSKIE